MAAACISYQSGRVLCEAISDRLKPWNCRQRLLDLPEGDTRFPDAINKCKALKVAADIAESRAEGLTELQKRPPQVLL